jgi:diguanylate cyclase (GGDEF)-like protein
VADVQAARERMREDLQGRERRFTLLSAGAFLVVAAAAAAFLPSEVEFSAPLALALVALYGAVSRIEFEIGPGSAVPTQLVLVPMLFVLPPGVVPLCVATALVAGGIVDRLRGRLHGARLPALLTSSWHSVGPALVIALLAPGPPNWDDLPIYVLALLAQFAFDGASVVFRHHFGRRVPLAKLASPLVLVAVVDSALAPVGLLAAFAASADPATVLCVVPLAGLLHVLAAERRERMAASIALGRAAEDASRAARSDPLTGIGNRLAWDEALVRATADVDAGVPATVVMVDMDRLKDTNDTYGHDAGDRLIQGVAAALARALRDVDDLARIGGDEFAALVLGAGADAADALVARIRAELAAVDVAGGIPVSASIGLSSCPPCGSLQDAVKLADERLYQQKPAPELRRTGTA